jgi:hypothetical protein
LKLFLEIRVYEGVAERTGVQFERDAIRRSAGCCRSMQELVRKARDGGEGYYYVPAAAWDDDRDRLELLKPWVVTSSPARHER